MKILNVAIGFSLLALAVSCGDTTSGTSESTTTAQAASTVAKDTAALTKIGEGIFKTNCIMCHAATKDRDLGNAPVLDSVKYHWPDTKKLGAYIRNAKENLNKDEYTTALYERYKDKLQMPQFEGLSDEELEGVILYLWTLSS